MPLVRVRYSLNHNGAVLRESTLKALGPALQVAVANRLSCDDEGGELAPDHVEVLFSEASSFDVSAFQVIIDVEAMHFKSRHENFKERISSMGEDVRNMLPGHVSFGLWAKLNNAAWTEDVASDFSFQAAYEGGTVDSSLPPTAFEPRPGPWNK